MLGLLLFSFGPVAHAVLDPAQATPAVTVAPPTATPVPPTATPVPPTPTPAPTSGSGSASGLPVVPIFLGLLFLGMLLAVLIPIIRARLRR